MTDSEFAAIFDEHKNAVYQFAWRMTSSPAVAEDIAQEVFLALLGGSIQFDHGRGSLRAVLISTARHMAWQRWRADQRWTTLEDEMPLPSAPLEHLGVEQAVATAIAALPPLQREAIILATYEGFSLQEIASTVAVEIGTIKARLHRARENLKRLLAPLKPQETRSKKYGSAQ
jgi:RNA polymerase sigma-70 factor (ECF subfamily)